ncbi:microtubule-associated tumor suppressor 1 isoform X1 [Astyanax mexicanus]|uniref:Microtubule-associated tumor suppressor 1 isoform X1 n=2 Tax=Astyanax mexicanus TaxID=7994 RepID=A0A8T2KKK6_ASTMX|nr:microtubule-associated tumor suppressor 1 isoform X1 [Astyanax mexicanus]
MSEIQPSADSMKPPDGVHHTMRLPLHSGATEGSAYAESSSSSSASPDSMRSLSSLSGGRTDSPLDLDMPDGIMGRKVTTGEDDSGIQSPDCRPENDNDNSTSIYLDADEQGWCEIRDDQDNVTLVLTHKQGLNNGCSDVNSNGNHGRRSSDDSSATEALLCCSGNEEEEDEDEEEDTFLSLTSVDVVMKCQNEPEEDEIQSSTRKLNVNSVYKLQNESLQDEDECGQMESSWRPDLGNMNWLHQKPLQESIVSRTEKSQLQSSTRRFSVGHVSELYKEAPRDSVKLHTEDRQLQSSSKWFSVDHISKLHQVALEDAMKLHTENRQLQSSTKIPSVVQVRTIQQEAPLEFPSRSDITSVTELNQEALPESVELHPDLGQMQSSIRGSTVNAVDDPQESVEPQPEDDEIPNLARTINMDSVKELQESVELYNEEDQIQNSSRTTNMDTANKLQELVELHTEEDQLQSSSKRLDVGPVSELMVFEEPQVETSLSQPLSEGETSIPLQEAQNTHVSSATITDTTCCVQVTPALQNTKDCTGQSLTRPATKPLTSKSTKPELKRFPRPDLKNVKAKIISRTSSVPRPASSSQSGAGTEKKPLPTRGRVANKKEQDKEEETRVTKKSRSSSRQARAAIPATVSDPNPKAIPPQTEKRPPPNTTPEVVVNRDQEESSSAEVMEVVKEEAEYPKEEVTLVEQSVEIPDDSDQKGSRVKPPKSTGGNVCVPAGVRAAAPAGAPKTCSPVSSSGRGPQKLTSSKLPVKGGGLPTTPSSSSLGSAASENNTAINNRGVAQVMKNEEKAVRLPSSSQGKPAIGKATVGIRNRANSTPVKPTSAGQKALTQTSTTAAKSTHNALQRSASARPNRPSGSAVEKGSRGVRSVPGRPHGGGGGGVAHTEEEEEKNLRLQNERKNQCIAQLRKLVAHGNRRLEALALVIQHIFTEREEALKQKKEVSFQLKNLKEELTHSVSCCERLQKEKEEVCVALEAAVLKLQQQHQEELSQLEETLRDFYSAEWDKTHQAYQEEADKYRALMQQQVEELKNKQEVFRKEQQEAHAKEMKTLKREYETTLTELRNSHKKDMQDLDNTLKQSETTMNEKLENLMAENEAMKAKLREEEERRKAIMEKGQKDPHLLYLEQELESLKVVLDIKTSKLHEQDKKIMQMDKLMEGNMKLEECMKKLQQENEDYRARMDKHAALSRQLSTEQAMLQQTLQLESKVNKRLSMENEELLWKLHNGDLSSPRRLSPSSPFHSPRNSASFPSAPVSPR